MLIIERSRIEALLAELDLLPMLEAAFMAYSAKRANVPPVGELILDDYRTFLPKFWLVKPKAAELGSLIESLRQATSPSHRPIGKTASTWTGLRW